MDLVSELHLNKGSITQEMLKNIVGQEIKSYAHAKGIKSPVEEGRRCWTLHYADGVQFHIDILPAIPDSENFRQYLESKEISPLPKYCSLQFKAKTNVQMPYEVHWQVVNTRTQVSKVDGLRGGFYKGTAATNGHTRNESTQYSGMHWIECFIVKNGICRARSGEFVINIE